MIAIFMIKGIKYNCNLSAESDYLWLQCLSKRTKYDCNHQKFVFAIKKSSDSCMKFDMLSLLCSYIIYHWKSWANCLTDGPSPSDTKRLFQEKLPISPIKWYFKYAFYNPRFWNKVHEFNRSTDSIFLEFVVISHFFEINYPNTNSNARMKARKLRH